MIQNHKSLVQPLFLNPIVLQIHHMSNEKNLGWLGYIGDDILPSYIGHYNKPL